MNESLHSIKAGRLVASARVSSGLTVPCVFAALLFALPRFAGATDYTHSGTTPAANWSVTTDWTPTAPTGGPNAAGDIVRYQGATSVVTTIATGAPVTTGSIYLQGSNTNSWTITPTAALTLNNSGAGASINNTDTSTGAAQAMILGIGTLTLADNLTISNTGGSTNATGAVQISSTVGGTGNVTFSNSVNNLNQIGSIRVQNSTNTFAGSVLFQNGTVTFNMSRSFGTTTNALTLGQSGQGSATLLSTTTNVNVANPITVASGSTGTLVLGTTSATTGSTVAYSGGITLNGDVSLYSTTATGGYLNISGQVSGTGSITTTGTGTVGLSTANTYSGNTNVASGGSSLRLLNTNAIQNSTLNYTGSTLIFDSSVSTHAFTFGGLTGSANIALQDNATTPNAVALSVGNNNASPAGYTGVLSGAGSLTKVGTGALTLSGANTYTGSTTVSAGTLVLSSTGSINSSNSVQVTVGTLTLQNASALSDAGTLSLNNGTTLNLNGSGTDTINGLVLGGTPVQAGMYAASDLSAMDPNITFSGGEMLNVVSTVPEPATCLAGALLVGALGWNQRRRLGGPAGWLRSTCAA